MTRIRLSKKDRIELEKIFLSCILAEDPVTDFRYIAGGYPGVSWRHFADKKHQALWRALESLDLKNIFERETAVEKELYEAGGRANPMLDESGDDLVMGEEGSAAQRQFESKVRYLSSARAWLERELAAVGALFLVGGKVYLREIYALCPIPGAAKMFAYRLGFIPLKEKPAIACWNCALAHGLPSDIKCENTGERVGADNNGGCDYWQKPASLFEKLMKEIKKEK